MNEVNKYQITTSIPVDEYIEYDFLVPEIQRPIDDDKIQQIIKSSKELRENHIVIQGVISIAKYSDNIYHLYDGQHRDAAIRILFEDGFNFDVPVQITNITNLSEINILYNSINNHTMVPMLSNDDIIRTLVQTSYTRIKKNIQSMISVDKTGVIKPYKGSVFIMDQLGRPTKRPRISITKFLEDLNAVINILELKTDKDIDDMFIKLSIFVRDMTLSNRYAYFKLATSTTSPFVNIGFVPPLFEKSQKYHSQWVDCVLKLYNKNDINDENDNNNDIKTVKTIPRSIRGQLWETYFILYREKCLCCGITDITSNDYEIGHVIAESKGGCYDISNLRPICKGCNLHMGNHSMKDYVKDHYPKRYNIVFPDNNDINDINNIL